MHPHRRRLFYVLVSRQENRPFSGEYLRVKWTVLSWHTTSSALRSARVAALARNPSLDLRYGTRFVPADLTGNPTEDLFDSRNCCSLYRFDDHAAYGRNVLFPA